MCTKEGKAYGRSLQIKNIIEFTANKDELRKLIGIASDAIKQATLTGDKLMLGN